MADLAPAETIAVEYNAVKTAFQASPQNARFIDLSGRLTFDDRKQIVARVEALAQKTGGRVWVLALPGKTDVNTFAKIHDDAKMSGSDVLFVFSQGQRHLHNKALGKDIGNEILKATNTSFYKQSQVKGVVDTLDEFEKRLSTAAPGTNTVPGQGVTVAPVKKGTFQQLQPFIIVALVAIIVWIALRKKPEPPKRPSLPKARARSSKPDRTPVPEKVTSSSRKRTAEEEENMSTVDETRRREEQDAADATESETVSAKSKRSSDPDAERRPKDAAKSDPKSDPKADPKGDPEKVEDAGERA